jgi:hypothetical protein
MDCRQVMPRDPNEQTHSEKQHHRRSALLVEEGGLFPVRSYSSIEANNTKQVRTSASFLLAVGRQSAELVFGGSPLGPHGGGACPPVPGGPGVRGAPPQSA